MKAENSRTMPWKRKGTCTKRLSVGDTQSIHGADYVVVEIVDNRTAVFDYPFSVKSRWAKLRRMVRKALKIIRL